MQMVKLKANKVDATNKIKSMNKIWLEKSLNVI